MAAASSSSRGSFKYDVFINFRGEDTRRGFVCHLNEALKQNALGTYIDSEDLRKGDNLSELLEAIKHSRLSIVVFSKDYASSTWCLKELVQILKCMDRQSQIVVPIFYEVDPSHVRKRKESFAEAFAKHKSDSNVDKKELKRWKSSLKRATNLSGYHSRNYRDDIELIGGIVEDILKKLIHISPTKTDGLIGMDCHMDEIDSRLQLGVDDFRVVGIWGMGGIGKSTIARAVFDRFRHQFEHSCFLDNVKEGFLTKNGAVQKVEEFLSGILKVNNPRTLDGGLKMMRERLGNKRILLVLDDVDNLDQIETLIGEEPTFGGGSRIIITTRDKTLLRTRLIYEPKLLTNEEALELFSWHAFKRNKYSEIYDAISRRAVEYAHGLPLALIVLGRLLDSRNVENWEDELGKIKKFSITSLNDKIGPVLEASYYGLDDWQKNIFLDIACFFQGMDEDFVTEFHRSCGFFPDSGLRVLVDRALLTFSFDGRLEMHDLIQEVGRDIVRRESPKDPGRRSRLWCYEHVHQVLAQNTATEAVEGMILDLSKIKEVYVNSEAFVGMKNLRLLQLFENNFTHVYEYKHYWPRKADYEPCVQRVSENLKFLSNELRILVWHGYPLKSLPIDFLRENLIYVDMCYSRIEQLWEGIKPLQNLVYIDLSLSKYLIKTPDFTEATNLERLKLRECTSLLEVHPSISALKSLVELDLRGCSNLKKFPNISGTMKELRELYLDETAITEMPSSINDLSGLKFLSLARCRELRSLPSSIHMKSLGNLNLSGCSKLTEFPEISEVMEMLTYLILDGTAIKELPSSVNNLSRLFMLSLTNCTSLVCLPYDICNLACLKNLSLTGCSSLSKLPENFGNLLSSCRCELKGSGIKQLPFSILCVASLSFNGCKEMTAPFSSWPAWDHQNPSYSVLISLDLSDCNLLELSDGIAHLSSLQEFDLSGNNKLENLPAAMNLLGNLRFLYLRGCKGLKSIPVLSSSMRDINAQDCTSLETVPTPQPPYAGDIYFRFFNCFKLVINTNIFIDIVESATDNQDYDFESGRCYRMSLPGSDIPDWFNHQSSGYSVTVQLPPNWLANKFLGFAICTIGNFPGAENRKTLESASCCCTLKANDGEDNFYFPLLPPFLAGPDVPLELDHMLLGYTNFRSLGEWHNERKYTEARFRIVTGMNPRSMTENDEVAEDDESDDWEEDDEVAEDVEVIRDEWKDCTWITSCGVRLFYMNPRNLGGQRAEPHRRVNRRRILLPSLRLSRLRLCHQPQRPQALHSVVDPTPSNRGARRPHHRSRLHRRDQLSTDLICNLENRETELRSKRRRKH